MVHYDFLKVDNARRISIPKNIFTSRNNFKETYQIELNFKVIHPVHVGSGLNEWDFTKKKQINENYKSQDEIRIPGSSLKGLTSFNFLALSGSAALTSELFGSTRGNSASSKVYFNDLIQKEACNLEYLVVNRMYKPRKRRYGYVKFYIKKANETRPHCEIEVIPRQSLLITTLVCIGLKYYELGGMLMSLGAYPDENDKIKTKCIKIGYAKPQCFGRMQLIPNQIKINRLYFEGLLITHEIQSDILEMINKFKEKLNKIDVVNRFNKLFRDDCLER
ncbi:MAG: RAMP superfamily CRISPR-associated protein [Promethearchaeota archaeon]